MNPVLRTIIIDDEPHNVENLAHLLAIHCRDVELVGTAANATAGKEMIEQLKPDLILLDIQMPGGSGFDLLQQLSAPLPELVFVTAYDKYALQAFRFSALDYLLKPVDSEVLKKAVSRAADRIREKQQNLRLENLLSLLRQQKKEEHRIALPTLKETRFVFVRDIVYAESSNNYTAIFLMGGEKIVVSKPIFEFEEMLTPYGFLRVHQRYLVNKQWVKSYIKEDGGFLLMEGDRQVPVSRSKKDTIRQALAG